MIFFFGVRSVHIAGEQNQRAICDSCNTQGSLIMHVFRSHVHLFWLPLFPLRKSGYTQCTHCKNVLEPREMSDAVRNEFEQVKSHAKGPIWQFGILFITLALFAIVFIVNILRTF